ncbi:hypothetical protein GAMM_30096 [Gammaproteobacteria bacterium]
MKSSCYKKRANLLSDCSRLYKSCKLKISLPTFLPYVADYFFCLLAFHVIICERKLTFRVDKMKIIAIRCVLVIGLLLAVVACAPTSVIPHMGGMFTVISTASSREKADELVTNKAKSVCEQQNTEVTIIDRDTIYQGIDKDQQKLVKLAHDILPESKTAGSYTPPKHEYKSTLTFRCE